LILLRIAEVIKAKGVDAKVYCQDPAYNLVDKQLLSKLGITVLENPTGLLEIDKAALEISLFPSFCVREILADDKNYWPMAMILNAIGHGGEDEPNYKLNDEGSAMHQ
jgi:hypothetical protein